MKRSAPLARKTPLRSVSPKLRRVKQECKRLRCTRPAARGLDICLTHAKITADALLGRRVRARGVCFRCGATTDLQMCHFVRRSYLATRWDEDNVWCGCRSCHHATHMRELEWEAEVERRMPGHLAALKARALTHQKPNYAVLIPALRAQLKELSA